MASPLVGYNTNVRHHGKVFHIQTEDSGLTHGHIFTHLFADGGRIIATRKTTYAEHVGTDRYPGIVKRLMQAQHKAMFIALRDGLFDENEAEGAKAFMLRAITLDEGDGAPSPARTDELTSSSSGAFVAADGPSTSPGASPAPIASAPPSDDDLERAARRLSEPSPADILVDTHATLPGSIAAPLPPAAARGDAQGAISKTFSKPASKAPIHHEPVLAPPAKGRYGTTQPAVKRSSPKPREQSLFGQDLLSEKSLDEVIMSYLAEDVDKE